MARKKGRRSNPFQLSLKRETINSILAVLIIGIGLLISVSFTRQGRFLDIIYTTLYNLIGWTLIFVPFLFVSGGLLLTKVKWSIANASVFLGSLITLISLTGLTKNGTVGLQLFLAISSLITTPGAIIFYLVGASIGLLILFETSLEDISAFIEDVIHLIQKTTGTLSGFKDKNGLSGKQMKIQGLDNSAPSVNLPNPLAAKMDKNNRPLAKPFTVNENRPISVAKSNLNPHSEGLTPPYQPPPIDMLSDEKRHKADRGDLNDNAKKIQETLGSFGIEAKVIEINCGPAVTQYAIEVGAGVKLSKISALQSDLALALAAPQGQIRIEAPIPGRSLVGIEIPNRSLEFVSLKQMLTSDAMAKNPSKTAVVLGLDVAGQPIVGDLAKMPHVLIAGATGSGKSVLVNAIIDSILFRATPDEVKFIMVDPKRVELTGYNGIPHLLTSVIVDPERVVNALQWAVSEMERRYKLFAEVGARNIAAYNENAGFSHMNYIVIIIDELADIMLRFRNEVETPIIRLAQMARAVGIHLVLATQRPSVDVITGLIKANVPCRIAFNVTSMVDSKVIIDGSGAEKLLGKGDMLYIPPDQAKPKRIQGAFVSDKEITDLVNYLRKVPVQAEYQENITRYVPENSKSRNSVSINGQEVEDVDALFEDAMNACIEFGKASSSFLQRRLSIGYSRAARIIDQLHTAGIVGPGEGSKPRDVLIKSVSEYYDRQNGNLQSPDQDLEN